MGFAVEAEAVAGQWEVVAAAVDPWAVVAVECRDRLHVPVFPIWAAVGRHHRADRMLVRQISVDRQRSPRCHRWIVPLEDSSLRRDQLTPAAQEQVLVHRRDLRSPIFQALGLQSPIKSIREVRTRFRARLNVLRRDPAFPIWVEVQRIARTTSYRTSPAPIARLRHCPGMSVIVPTSMCRRRSPRDLRREMWVTFLEWENH